MDKITIPKADVGYNISFTATTSAGAAKNLAGYVVTLEVWHPEAPGTVTALGVCAHDVDANGTCHYVVTALDFLTAGVLHAHLKLTAAGVEEKLEPFAISVEEITATYCTLWEIKSELNIITDDNDDVLMSMCEDATGFIKDYTRRSFIAELATRYFDGTGTTLWLDDELMSITGAGAGVYLDEDGDGTYECTLLATDYNLFPYNTTPKTSIAVSANSDYGGFASGIAKGVKITGMWGASTTPPDSVRRACKIQTCRWWNRHLGGYASEIGGAELGPIAINTGLDADVKELLKHNRHWYSVR